MTAPAGAVRSRRALAGWVAGGAALICGLVALGVWQVERRAWKLDLIARVEARIHAAPAPPPARAEWPAVSAAADEYRRVALAGTYRHEAETLTQAVTALGAGSWVLVPLVTTAGDAILVNRGFVPFDRRDAIRRESGPVRVVGLLRMSEPGGGFLRANDPAAGRWYSRDVAAIAAARGLGPVAPFFVDAEGGPDPQGWPRGGLTVVAFPNNHAVYALTWFALAGLTAGALVMLLRLDRGMPSFPASLPSPAGGGSAGGRSPADGVGCATAPDETLRRLPSASSPHPAGFAVDPPPAGEGGPGAVRPTKA